MTQEGYKDVLRFTVLAIGRYQFNLSGALLNADRCQLGSENVRRLVEGVSQVGQVRVLNLAGNGVTDEDVSHLITHLFNPDRLLLEKLDLKDNRITDAGARRLLDAFEQSRTCRELSLKGNDNLSRDIHQRLASIIDAKKAVQAAPNFSTQANRKPIFV